MQEVRSGLVPGAVVQARGERWRVRDTRRLTGVVILTLDALEGMGQPRSLTLLLPFDRVGLGRDRGPIGRRRQAVVRGTLYALAQMRPDGGLWALPSARVDVLGWQLAPALAVLAGASRLLLADAVGLGKTIQAGLVLAELYLRGMVERALVLAPPAVRAGWAHELRARFGLPVDVVDLPALLHLERSGAVGANPWSQSPVIVSSIDLVKRPEILGAVERAPVDLLIVDEAHHVTPGTDRHAAVERLARQVPWVVLASATPHSGDAAAYRALLDVGGASSEPGDRMRVFRRSHGDVRLVSARRTHALGVRTSREERELLGAVLAYARDLCRVAATTTPGVQLLASVLARRAASSPLAAQRTLQRRLDSLAHGAAPSQAPQPLLPWEELEEEEHQQPWLSVQGFEDVDAERECLRRLVALAESATANWSKGVRLRRLVGSIGEPAVVFSEFRDTLDACRAELEPAVSVSCLHGELDAGERHRRLSAFLEGRVRVLLTTDVAGEGLNLHGPSRLVITVEWPWSPLRIEQRIGRVHRLGQTRTVHAIHLTARGSYEETVVARMLQRAARAAADLSPVSDQIARAITEHVLGLAPGDARPAPSTGATEPIDRRAQSEASRVTHLRRLAALGHPLPPDATACAVPRRGARSRVVAVLEIRCVDAGFLRWSNVVALEIRLRRAPAHRREWRVICRQLLTDPRVRQAAIDGTGRISAEDSWAIVRARLRWLRAARHKTGSRAVQPSLFDRRAWRDAESRASDRQQWDERQTRLEARLQPSDPPSIATRVLALLPLERSWR